MELLNVTEEVTFTVDEDRRMIRGLVVPWDGISTPKDGRRFQFSKGAIKAVATKFVKLFEDHSPLKSFGRAVEMEETDLGLEMAFKVSEGPDGDALLTKTKNGLKTGLSVGVEFDLEDTKETQPGIFAVALANLKEVSVVGAPSFTNSRIISVTASAENPIGESMTTNDNAVLDKTANDAGNDAPATKENDQVKLVPFSIPEGYELVKTPVNDGPEVVAPRNTNTAVVTEPKNYVFDARGDLQNGKYDFGLDLVQGLNVGVFNNLAARQRVEEFLEAQFDVVRSNVNELAPDVNVPRYIDKKDYVSPVWQAINKGTVAQMNGGGTVPFQWPIFSSSSGLVAAGTEGTEPSSGAYVTSNASVTPTTLRGKIKISRETWDAGGIPNIGDVVFKQMVRDYNEALEAKIIATLDAASPTSLATFTAGGGGTLKQTLASEMRAALALLQYARGGKTMDVMFAQVDLYSALIAAADDSKRPLFPALGPMNADGTSRANWGAIDINGTLVIPAWGLAATGTVAASSYLIDTTAVDGWADAPRKLFFEYEVSNVYLGIWGYAATAINDLTGVREVIYDPTTGD